MKKGETFLHMKIKLPLKNVAKRHAKALDLTLTQWVARAIIYKIEDENA